MEKLDILYRIISLNKTLIKATEDIRQNTDAGMSADILADMQDALKAISSKAPLVLDQEMTAEVLKCADALRNSCDALIRDRNVAHAFFTHCNKWGDVFDRCLYLEAINAANTCGKDHEEQGIGLLEIVYSCNPQVQIKALAGFLLGRKFSKQKPRRAYNLVKEAFELNNSLCASITKNDSPLHGYVYQKGKDVFFEACPICHEGRGTPYFCALPLVALNYTPFFNPVKLWMQCGSCGQLFAYNFPYKLIEPQPEAEELGDAIYMEPRLQFLPIFGGILRHLLSYSKGKRLLEVGAGTGEMIAAALEYGCEVEAIEISGRHAQMLRDLLGVDVHCMDFLRYDTAGRFDIITMGDVLEHMLDPAAAIRKARALLEEEGILWVSTPNFESGYSRIMKYTDPMWDEPWHFTYFSYDGLKKLLEKNGFTILDYAISFRYNGSMELIARKA